MAKISKVELYLWNKKSLTNWTDRKNSLSKSLIQNLRMVLMYTIVIEI